MQQFVHELKSSAAIVIANSTKASKRDVLPPSGRPPIRLSLFREQH
jgi:hypothetical protein